MPPNDLILTKANLMSSRESLRSFFIDSTFKSLERGNSFGPSSFHFSPENPTTVSTMRQVMENNPNNAWHSVFVDTFGNTIGSSLNVAGQTPLAGIGVVDITSVLPVPKFPFPTSKEEATRWLLSEALSELGHLKPNESVPKIPSQEDLDKISEINIASATAWIASKIGVPFGQLPEIPKLPQIPTLSLLDLPGYEKLKEYAEKIPTVGIPPIPSTPPFPGIPPIPEPPQIPGIPPIPGFVLPAIALGFIEMPLKILKSLLTDIEKITNLALSALSDIKKIPELIIGEIIKQFENLPNVKDILNSKPKFFISSFLSVVKFLASAIGAVLVGSILGAGALCAAVPQLVSNIFG
jgi:hypothetical protein